MLSNEEKHIINLLRVQVCDFSIDGGKLLKLLIEHNLFLLFYNSCDFVMLDDKSKKEYRLVYNYFTAQKKQNFSFFKHIISLLNESKINYIAIKGFVTEYILHNDITSRTFSDIDVIMSKNDVSRFLDLCRQDEAMTVATIEDKYDFSLHEIKVNLNYEGNTYCLELKDRHRELSVTQTKMLFDYSIKSIIVDQEALILGKEAMMISQIIYIFNYYERIVSYLYMKKIKLSYFKDLFDMINSFDKIFDHSLFLSLVKKLDFEMETLLVLHYTDYIFSHDSVPKFVEKVYGHLPEAFLRPSSFRIDKRINILSKIFRRDEVRNFVREYLQMSVYLSDYNKVKTPIQAMSSWGSCFAIFDVLYKYECSKTELLFHFKQLENIKYEKFVIYIILYYDNVYGEYNSPYEAISIRFDRGKVFAFRNLTIDKANNVYNYNEEQKKYEKFIESKSDELVVNVNYKEMGINNSKGQRIGWNIELVEIYDDNKTYTADRNNFDISSVTVLEF